MSETSSDGGFEIFWKNVHKKVGKTAAKKQYALAIKGLKLDGHPDPHAYIAEKAAAFARAVLGHPDPSKLPHPATWLSQGRFEDDSDTWSEWRVSAKVDSKAVYQAKMKEIAEQRKRDAAAAESKRQAIEDRRNSRPTDEARKNQFNLQLKGIE